MGAGMSGERRMLALTDSLGGARGFAFAPNVASTAIAALAYVAADFHFYTGYAWLAIAFVVAAMTTRRLRAGRGDDTDQVALALAGSAIAYTLPYFFVGVAPDYRYLYWTVVATLVAAILVALPRATPAAVSR
jgi:cobalamin synthase